jgi:uncharacterized Zn finger protein
MVPSCPSCGALCGRILSARIAAVQPSGAAELYVRCASCGEVRQVLIGRDPRRGLVRVVARSGIRGRLLSLEVPA